ncbi:hypothetical protein IWZ00DRAFT_164082 [Phyllosticta capitalensis]
MAKVVSSMACRRKNGLIFCGLPIWASRQLACVVVSVPFYGRAGGGRGGKHWSSKVSSSARNQRGYDSSCSFLALLSFWLAFCGICTRWDRRVAQSGAHVRMWQDVSTGVAGNTRIVDVMPSTAPVLTAESSLLWRSAVGRCRCINVCGSLFAKVLLVVLGRWPILAGEAACSGNRGLRSSAHEALGLLIHIWVARGPRACRQWFVELPGLESDAVEAQCRRDGISRGHLS